MLAAISNVLPIHIQRGELSSQRTAPDVSSTGLAEEIGAPVGAAAAEAPRPVNAAEERSDAGYQEPEDARTEDQASDPKETSRREVEPGDLTEDEEVEVRRLKERDQEVRRHEQAHASVGGSHTGAPSYEYERGPDGRQYAVGGHVPVDVSAVPGDPDATVAKMRQIKRAALAPASPSGADRRIASQATQKMAAAQRELQAERAREFQGEPAPEVSAPKAAAPTSTIGTFEYTDAGVDGLGAPAVSNGSGSGPAAAFSSGNPAVGGVPGATNAAQPSTGFQAYAATAMQSPKSTISVIT